MPVHIDDDADARLALYRGIKDRQLAAPFVPGPLGGDPGLFMAEGVTVLGAALDAGVRWRSAVFGAAQARSHPGLVARLESLGVPVYTLAAGRIESLAGFDLHRGVLALAQRPPAVGPAELLRRQPPAGQRAPGPHSGVFVGLEDLTNHDNVGGVFRSAGAFGVRGALLSERTADPLYRKSLRVSCGQAIRVPFARVPDWVAGVSLARAAAPSIRVVALCTRPGSVPISQAARVLAQRPDAPVLVLIGSEGEGLSPGAIAAADILATIPMAPGVDSLNATVAASIALHRLVDHQ